MHASAGGEDIRSGFTVGVTVGDRERYELLEELAGSSLRQVFRAFDREVEVEVALWFMAPESLGGVDEALEAAQRVRSIRSPHVLRLFDSALVSAPEQGELLCLSWQLGTSASLGSLLSSEEPASPGQLWAFAEGLATALQAGHDKGIVHGWFSPADVVEVAGQVKLCGLGLLSRLGAAQVVPYLGGDARYVAPELVAGGAATATPSSDWFSLAMVLLDLASGQRAQSAADTQERLEHGHPELWEALEPALRSDASQRPHNAAEFLSGLRAVCGPLDSRGPVASTIVDAGIDSENIGGLLCDDDDEEATEIHVPGFYADEESVGSEQRLEQGGGAAMAPVVHQAVSMKTPLQGEPTPNPDFAKSPVKPVIRSLTSLPGADVARQDLGNYAPPKAAEVPRRRKHLLSLALALAGGAATVSLVLALQNSSSKAPASSSEPAPVSAEDLAPNPRPPPPQAAPVQAAPVALLAPCPDAMVLHRDKQGDDFCIDVHESPGLGRTPQTGMSSAAAQGQCEAVGKRLCTGREWERACRLGGTESWPYGGKYQPEICNVKSREIGLSGASANCRTSLGIFDMSGNVAEWVIGGDIRGGSAQDRSLGRCSQVRPNPAQQQAYSDVGFRCCADAIDSGAPSD